jgi:catechol 2,3-dioxygenase-like lactoylglutathione lyase family enzyme
MKVLGVSFLGIRTEQFAATARFFTEIMGLPLTRGEPDVAGFRLGERTTLEVYGPGDTFHAFFGSGPVVGFRVEDFDSAYVEMQAAGIAFIGPPQHEGGASWSHFRGPDGNVYEIAGPGLPRDENGAFF